MKRLIIFSMIGVVFLQEAAPLYEWVESFFAPSDYWYSWAVSLAGNIQLILSLVVVLKLLPTDWFYPRSAVEAVLISYILDTLGMVTINMERYDNLYWQLGYVLISVLISATILVPRKRKALRVATEAEEKKRMEEEKRENKRVNDMIM